MKALLASLVFVVLCFGGLAAPPASAASRSIDECEKIADPDSHW